MYQSNPYVIALSRVAQSENVSDKTAWRLARKLESDGKIEVQRTPTGRGFLNVRGYERLRDEIRFSAEMVA